MDGELRRGLAAILPAMRSFARFLTHDVSSADDLVQETVLRVLRAHDQYKEGTNLKAWILKVQRNLFYEGLRSSKREQEVMADFEDHARTDPHGPPRYQDQVMDLSVLIWRLPVVMREALILVGAQGFSYEEAAQICDCSVGTMKARVSRARDRLAEMREGDVARI